jgi:lipid II:glycine glycyltransferase (peptidoglycan interpeptide bridge formation enzyme)
MQQFPMHPLQSPEWGEFRKKTGITVLQIAPGFQMTIHPLPKIPWNIGYLPKCAQPTKEIINKLYEAGKQHKCVFIKMEPNTIKNSSHQIPPTNYQIRVSPHPLFTNYTFHLDITQSEEQLLKNMKQKTRYNIRIAQKNNVMVNEEISDKAFETYLSLSRQTWDRQKFFGHTEHYHRLMWNTLQPAKIAHLLIAYFTPEHGSEKPKPVPLAAWILFLYKNVLYYPYGASSTENKDVMASNLMMWEAIRFGKKHSATLFDTWGSLGPNPDPTDPWYGFHRFKEGYGGNLVEFVGSYDLIINPLLYQVYNIIHPIRQFILGLPRL